MSVCIAMAYDLIVIEDEDTPLAASANVNYYLPTVIAVLTILLAGLLIYWLIKRNNYKKRLLELRQKLDDHDKRTAITIRGIKDEIARLETELVADCF